MRNMLSGGDSHRPQVVPIDTSLRCFTAFC